MFTVHVIVLLDMNCAVDTGPQHGVHLISTESLVPSACRPSEHPRRHAIHARQIVAQLAHACTMCLVERGRKTERESVFRTK